MDVSGVSGTTYYQSQTAGQQPFPVQEGQAGAPKEEQELQPTLTEMMKEAKEKAAKRDELLKKTKSSQRYGDAAILAYSKLARAKSAGEVDAASGYARRQIARLRAAKAGDSDNADRIQAAINQLQKAVNRAGRKKRELSQEKLTAARQAKLEREKRIQEAKRLRHQLRSRQTMRVQRESGYLREAAVDNRVQEQLASSRLELRQQMDQLNVSTQATLEAAIQGYSAGSGTEAAPAPELSVQA